MGELSEKFDLATFIAYLLPGLLVQMLLFMLCDTMHTVIKHSSSIVVLLSADAAKIGVFGIAVLIVGYLWGFLVDVYGHSSSANSDREQKQKTRAYTEVINCFQSRRKDLPQELIASHFPAGDTFIDTMFYHYATASHWARLKWLWAFYEATRNFVALAIPLYFIISLYLGVILFINLGLDCRSALAFSIGLALATTYIAFNTFHHRLTEYRDRECYVYYRGRAYVVLGVLVDRLLTSTSQNRLALSVDQSIRNSSGWLLSPGLLPSGHVFSRMDVLLAELGQNGQHKR
jgi:hypothetical protein